MAHPPYHSDQGIIPEVVLAAHWPCQWCKPFEEWCEYDGGNPALHKYVSAGREGWTMLAEDLHRKHLERQRQEAEKAAARRARRQSFLGDGRPKL